MSSSKIGRAFEDLCTPGFELVGRCTITKCAAPVRVVRYNKKKYKSRNTGEFVGFFESKGTCDYEGGYQGVAVSIEAKHTSAARFPFSAIKDHQWVRLTATERMGGMAGVLLSWLHPSGTETYYGIVWRQVQQWAVDGKKSITPDDLFVAIEAKVPNVFLLERQYVLNGVSLSLYDFLGDLWERRRK